MPRFARVEYLAIMQDYCRRYGVDIWGYYLMSNHVHLIAVPVAEESLGLAIGRAHMKYSRHANRRQKWWGHLWANRYYSTLLDYAHAWIAMKYIERNPVRAGITATAWDYPWSSASYHVLGTVDPLLTPCPLNIGVYPGTCWGEWLTGDEDMHNIAQIRTNTHTGWPTGTPEFFAALEQQIGRCLTRQPAGRKSKKSINT